MNWTARGRAVVFAVLFLPMPLLAQEETAADSVDVGLDNNWFPGAFLVAPIRADPLEVRLGGGLFATKRDIDDSIDGSNLEAQVAVGVRIPVVRFQEEAGGRPAIELGFEVGVFSRFFMQSIEKEQIDTDYRVGVPLGIQYGMWDFRLTLQHLSSHFGDDYIDDNPQEVFQSSREGFELLVGVRPGFLGRVYVAGDLNLGRSEDFTGTGLPGNVEKWAFRFGAEWDPARWGGETIAPFAAANFETTEFTERLASHVMAGAAFRINTVRLLLSAEFFDGPSPMGQFRTVDERWIGASLTVEL